MGKLTLFHVLVALCVTVSRYLSFGSPIKSTGEYYVGNCNSPIPKMYYEYPLTMVTAFFRFGKSKHFNSDYTTWIHTFLSSLTAAPLVLFTTKDVMEEINVMRQNLSYLDKRTKGSPILFIVCESVWSLDWINRKPVAVICAQKYKSWKHIYYTHQPPLDEDKDNHSPELYAVWNQKPWMTAQVAKQNPFSSKHFFWVDIGSFRDGKVYSDWPSVNKIECIFDQPATKNKLMMGLVDIPFDIGEAQYYRLSYGPIKGVFVQGGIFGGTSTAVIKFEEEHRYLHDLFVSQDQFIGREEDVFDASAYYNYKDKFFFESYLKYEDCKLKVKGFDPWFYFQMLLADPKDVPAECETTEFVTYQGDRNNIQEIKLDSCYI